MSCLCCCHFLLELQAFITDRRKVKLKVVSSTAIKVIVAEPSGNYGRYKIRYRETSGRRLLAIRGGGPYKKKEVQIDESGTYLLKGLRPDTEYEIGIKDLSPVAQTDGYSTSKFKRTLRGDNRSGDRAPLLS